MSTSPAPMPRQEHKAPRHTFSCKTRRDCNLFSSLEPSLVYVYQKPIFLCSMVFSHDSTMILRSDPITEGNCAYKSKLSRVISRDREMTLLQQSHLDSQFPGLDEPKCCSSRRKRTQPETCTRILSRETAQSASGFSRYYLAPGTTL